MKMVNPLPVHSLVLNSTVRSLYWYEHNH